MAAPVTVPPSVDTPPSYDETIDVCQPTILILAGQSIHAESADSAPLYQLNRGVASLTHATQTVEFQRVQYTVKTSSGGEPSVKPRERHVYNLKHIHKVPGGYDSWPSESPNWYIESTSSTTREAGTLGLKKSRFPGRKPWRVLPVDLSGKNSKHDYGLPTFGRDAKSVFEIRRTKVGYEWMDGEGQALAVEDEGDDTHRLVVTASLPRKTLDALVAMWCCRLWQYSADNTESIYKGLQGQSERQTSKPFDIVRSTGPVMQNNVSWDQTVARRDRKGHRLGDTRVLRAMASCAHGSGIGGKYQPELAAGDICTRTIICRKRDVGQS